MVGLVKRFFPEEGIEPPSFRDINLDSHIEKEKDNAKKELEDNLNDDRAVRMSRAARLLADFRRKHSRDGS